MERDEYLLNQNNEKRQRHNVRKSDDRAANGVTKRKHNIITHCKRTKKKRTV